MADQRVKPPKTPLKRVSRNSLRSLTLSGSYPRSSELDGRRPGQSSSHGGQSVSNPTMALNQISSLFVDLNDAITDLHINLSNLDLVCQDLNGFNEAFSAFIYGLRMNAYTTKFHEAPNLQSFHAVQEMKEAECRQQVAEQEAKNQQDQMEKHDETIQNDQDDTFLTSDRPQPRSSAPQASTSSSNPNMNSQSTQMAKSKPKNFTQAPKAQQKQLLKFTEQILSSLPLKFREQQPQRQEMELVICVLKLNPNGLLIKEIVKLEPTLAMHRARDCATSLVAAKKAVKINKDGIVYKLI